MDPNANETIVTCTMSGIVVLYGVHAMFYSEFDSLAAGFGYSHRWQKRFTMRP
jgi:hypothetical protein